jgi:hypothetical protein
MNNAFTSKRRQWRFTSIVAQLFIQTTTWIFVLVTGMYSEKPFDFSKISWIVRDKTWYSTQTFYREMPLFGKHYFGDLQIFFGFIADPNPYLEVREIRPQIPPFGLSFYSLLNIWSPQIGLAIYISLVIVCSALVIRLWLRTETIAIQVTAYCGLILLNTSVLMSVDRGNILVIVLSVIGYLFYKMLHSPDFTRSDALLLAVAISLKPYLVLILLFFIFERKYQLVYRTIIYGIACNVLSATLYGDSLFSITREMLNSQSGYNNSDSLLFSIKFSTSAFRVLYDFVNLFKGREYAIRFFENSHLMIALPGVIYLSLVVIICSLRKIPMWIRMISILSTIQMVVAASPRYDLVWSFVGALVLLHRSAEFERLDTKTIPRKELTIALLCTVGFIVGGLPLENSKSLSPIVWTIMVFLICAMYLVPKQKRVPIQLDEH